MLPSGSSAGSRREAPSGTDVTLLGGNRRGASASVGPAAGKDCFRMIGSTSQSSGPWGSNDLDCACRAASGLLAAEHPFGCLTLLVFGRLGNLQRALLAGSAVQSPVLCSHPVGERPPPRIWREASIMGMALEGLRAVDFTHNQDGPSRTQRLARSGADVVKIERPLGGDEVRTNAGGSAEVSSSSFCSWTTTQRRSNRGLGLAGC
jgi:hypothetical protein